MESNQPNPAFYHAPIMVEEVLSLLQPARGGVFVDGTLGGGGHSEAILNLLPADGRLFGIDRDRDALAAAEGGSPPSRTGSPPSTATSFT